MYTRQKIKRVKARIKLRPTYTRETLAAARCVVCGAAAAFGIGPPRRHPECRYCAAHFWAQPESVALSIDVVNEASEDEKPKAA